MKNKTTSFSETMIKRIPGPAGNSEIFYDKPIINGYDSKSCQSMISVLFSLVYLISAC